ncbi:MAG TPA: DsrE family protein [Anseongella sp.]
MNESIEHRVVMQVTQGQPAAQRAVITQIKNIQRGLPGTAMHVVCYGQGIYLLVADTTEVAAQLAELGQANVSFVICENAMRSNKITLGDLVTGTVVVPSGLVEIILKQEAGWAYVKGGH